MLFYRGKAGAGGRWPVIGETPDPNVVRQQDTLSCGPACGEMVLRDRSVNIAQSAIAVAAGGVPVTPDSLADALDTLDTNTTRLWQGGAIQIPGAPGNALVRALNQTGSWIAFMKELANPISHTVVVDGLDAAGQVSVRDPWEGTRYTMTMPDFLEYWTGIAILQR